MIFLILGCTTCALLFWKRNYIQENLEDFNRLKSAISQQEKITGIKLFLTSLKIACQTKLYQSNNKSIITIPYKINNKDYILVTKVKKGPMRFVAVRDENDQNITDLVLPYYGPNHDWHGYTFIPQFWGRQKLEFELITGEKLVFTQDQPITL